MTKCSISISELYFFSPLVKDYLSENPNLKNLYSNPPNEEGLLKSIDSKASNYNKRGVLSKVVDDNYSNKTWINEKEGKNIALLKGEALCVTTAHQPNLFLGPLYTLTKAISAISLANHLNKVQTKRQIVPVFIIGGEDHDQEELLHVYLFGNQYKWETSQIGSVGKMIVDDSLISILHEFTSKFGETENAKLLRSIFHESYQKGATLSQAFGEVLRRLLGKYGLIVLDINIPEVKQEMKGIFHKEIESGFAINATRETIEFLSKNYSVQANPTEINLFEYVSDERVKIKEKRQELIEKLESSPESFSPSVILRPLMQQMIMPSIANIGGGAEVAYWLELKAIFDTEAVDFPVILLRDIYSVLDQKSWDKWKANGLTEKDFFLDKEELIKKIILEGNSRNLEIEKRKSEISDVFRSIGLEIGEIDKSLIGSVEAEQVKAHKAIEQLYHKAIKSIKRNEEVKLSAMEKIKNKVFEKDSLKEREENFASYYIQYGERWIEDMIENHHPLKGEWTLDIR